MTKGLVIVPQRYRQEFRGRHDRRLRLRARRDRRISRKPAAIATASIWSRVEDEKDIETLRYWIARHAEETGSPRANWILEKWDFMLPKFVKVFPHEYKRVLGVPQSG